MDAAHPWLRRFALCRPFEGDAAATNTFAAHARRARPAPCLPHAPPNPSLSSLSQSLFIFANGKGAMPSGALSSTQTITSLFNVVEHANKLVSSGQSVCLSSVHWGLGIRALGPITRFPHGHTEERRASIDAYR